MHRGSQAGGVPRPALRLGVITTAIITSIRGTVPSIVDTACAVRQTHPQRASSRPRTSARAYARATTRTCAATCSCSHSRTRTHRYKLTCSSRTQFISRLTLASSHAAGQIALNLSLYRASENGSGGAELPAGASPGGRDVVATSHAGVYWNGCAGAAVGPVNLDPGTYLLVPSTFNPWAGQFKLVVYSQPSISVTALR